MNTLNIFNYNTNQDAYLISELTNRLLKDERYYLTRSWEGGPHIKVVFDKELDQSKIETIKGFLKPMLAKIAIDQAEEEKLKIKYKKHASVLSKLEDKQSVSTMEKHGAVNIVDDSFFYHNREITEFFHDIRLDMQPLLTDLYLHLRDNFIPIQGAFPALFHYVSEAYKVDDMNKGYFSYISHVHGFFELATKQKLSYSEETFEKYYQSNKTYIKEFEKEYSTFIERWLTKWEELFHLIKRSLPSIIDQTYVERIKEEFNSIESNFDNDFHNRFANYAKEHDFVNNDSATAYRFLINVLYISLPFLKISALKKQQFIYMAYRYTEDKYSINWREQIGVI